MRQLPFLLLALTFLTTSAQAQDALVTDRPDFTESAAIVPVRHVQIEAGATLVDGGSQLLASLARIGVLGRVEARIGWDGLTAADAGSDGAGDLSLGAKFFVGQRDGYQLAMLGTLFLPTGQDGVGRSAAEPEIRLAGATTLTDALGLGANLGIAFPEVGDERRRAYVASLSLGQSLRPGLGLFLECFGQGIQDADWTWSIDSGLTYQIRPHIQIDVLAGTSLTDSDDAWFVGGGFSIRLPQ